MFDIKRSLEPLNIPPIPSHEILAIVFTAFPTGQTGELWLLLSYPQQKPITAPSFFRQAAGWPSVHKRHASHSSPRALKRRSWDLLKRGASGSGVVTHTLCIYIYMPWYDGVIWLKNVVNIYMYIYMLGIVGLYHILKFPDISWYIV